MYQYAVTISISLFYTEREAISYLSSIFIFCEIMIDNNIAAVQIVKYHVASILISYDRMV